MTKNNIAATIFAVFTFVSACTFAQTNTANPATTAPEDEFAKKKIETKIVEVIPTDSVPPSELVSRASKWMKEETDKYKKASAAAGEGKAECIAVFQTKPKELNPQVDYTGRITMKVLVECKNSKYRYTISDIRHSSKNGKSSAGSIDNVVPDCGSMGMTDIVWKKLKGEALRDAAQVVTDLKAAMGKSSTEVTTDEW